MKTNNRFERHLPMTIFFIVLVSVLALDFFVANIYKLINGYPWTQWQSQKTERSYRIRSEIYHHDLAKNKEINNAQWGDIVYKVCTNSLGFKDKKTRNIPLVSNTYRILFMGDSFTEGIGVEYDHTFVGIIDSALSKQSVEVLNAGVSWYSPIIYWRKIKYLIEDVGLKFNEVVLFLSISDVENEAIYYDLDEKGNVKGLDSRMDGERNNEKYKPSISSPTNIKAFIRNNTILFYTVLQRLRCLLKVEPYKIDLRRSLWTINRDVYKDYGEKGLIKCDLYVNKLYDLLKRHGIKLTVAVFPWPDQIYYNDSDSVQVTQWKDWCASKEVPFINYFPYFVTGKIKEDRELVLDKYYLWKDMHWNKEGHRRVANVFLSVHNKYLGKTDKSDSLSK